MMLPTYFLSVQRLVFLCGILLFATGLLQPLSAEVFRFRFNEGDTYRINSTVNEDVYVNGQFSHKAYITNRVTVAVSDVQAAVNGQPASALHTCTFMTSEQNSNRTFSWGREYPSVFRRDAFGVYNIGEQYFMPVIRDVPVFPDYDVKIGQSWQHQASEAHDLRDNFNIQKPFIVPVEVSYTYKGTVQKEQKNYHLIEVNYDLYYEIPLRNIQNRTGRNTPLPPLYPVRTMGYSKQRLYWDNERGLLPSYDEVFTIQMELNTGAIIEYRGTAQAEITEMPPMNKDEMANTLDKDIRDLGLAHTNVQKTDEGVMISLENIQFEADSARLLPGEKEKIEKIGELLRRYPDYELLISGHTARAGKVEDRQQLSEERAAAVAQYLIELGVRSEHHIFTRGFGSDKPVAPNTTEENMARNRRVEITVLEK
ncbi:MAG: OmpA family protein [Treponema sp.]|uniref:OmpA family protein n=1 Tax=Treponema sp. TaxID=166 RepID=UPI003FA28D31